MRATRWIGTEIDFAEFATSLVVIGSETQFEELTSPTVIRCRGRITVKLNATTGDTYEATSYRMGIRVLHKDLVAGDIDFTDYTTPWLWYMTGALWQAIGTRSYWNGSAEIDYNAALGANTRKDTHDIDIKAMRKVNRNEHLVLLGEKVTEAGSPGNPEWYGHVRTLVKE